MYGGSSWEFITPLFENTPLSNKYLTNCFEFCLVKILIGKLCQLVKLPFSFSKVDRPLMVDNSDLAFLASKFF